MFMPLYAYQCRTCGHNFEARQSFNDAPLADCPNCHTAGSVFRVIQPTGVVFKGSGWYITDSKGKKDSVLGSANKSNGDTASTTSTDKTETKPEKAEVKETPAKTTEAAAD
jgi:putative FmdB family regulatory protein